MEPKRNQPTKDQPTPSRKPTEQPAAQHGSTDAPYRALRQPTRPKPDQGPDARENEEGQAPRNDAA